MLRFGITNTPYFAVRLWNTPAALLVATNQKLRLMAE